MDPSNTMIAIVTNAAKTAVRAARTVVAGGALTTDMTQASQGRRPRRQGAADTQSVRPATSRAVGRSIDDGFAKRFESIRLETFR